MKRSDGLWRFACGDVFIMRRRRNMMIVMMIHNHIQSHTIAADSRILTRVPSLSKITTSGWGNESMISLLLYCNPTVKFTSQKLCIWSLASNLKEIAGLQVWLCNGGRGGQWLRLNVLLVIVIVAITNIIISHQCGNNKDNWLETRRQ